MASMPVERGLASLSALCTASVWLDHTPRVLMPEFTQRELPSVIFSDRTAFGCFKYPSRAWQSDSDSWGSLVLCSAP